MGQTLFNPETGEIDTPEGDAVEGCPSCQVKDAQIAAMRRDLEMADLDLRNKRREIGKLRKELEEERNESPRLKEALEVYELWIELTGRNPNRVKFGEKRKKAVLARLGEGRDLDYLKEAVYGLKIGATVMDEAKQRQVLLMVMQATIEAVDEEMADHLRALYQEGMKGVQVYDDLELLCRNEVNVERFYEVAQRARIAEANVRNVSGRSATVLT